MSVLLDLDLLLDLRGLQFCLARTTEFLENSHIASLLGLPLLDHSRGGQRLMGMLKTTRPRLNAYSLVMALKQANRGPKVFSFVEESVVAEMLQKFQWVPSPVCHVDKADCVTLLRAQKSELVLVHLPEVATSLRDSGVNSICLPVCKHQGLPMQSLLTAVPGLEVPALDEFPFWKGHYLLPAPVRLSGSVIHGFGKGSTELGFPTANIEPQQSRVMAQLIPGVYCGLVYLEDHPQPYKAAVSIGWNPQYDNTEKTTEVHILHTFQHSLYGLKLTVQLTAYLRAETAFAHVAELIKAIQYDVRLTEEVLGKA